MAEEAPRLNPSRRATDKAKLEDLAIYGVVFVVNIDGEEWLINPTQVSVYTEPEDDDDENQ